MEPDDERDWELVSADPATAAPAFGQLYIRIVQAHIDQPHGTDLGSLRADVALTKIQGLAASGSTTGIFNTNQPHWNHDFLFGPVSADAPLNISIMSSSMSDPVSKFSIPLSTLSIGHVDDTWHPNDDGILPAKIRVILCFTPHLPHELPSAPPLLNVKSLGVRVPALFDSEKSRLLALNLVPFQLHLDRDFLYPEETISGILTFSARNAPAFIHTAPDISIIGTETVYLPVQNPYNGTMTTHEKKFILNERRICPLPSKAVPIGETYSWTFTFKLPPLLPPNFERAGKEIVAYRVRASIALEPGGESNTYEIEAPFKIGGPLPPVLQRERPKTHSFWFEKDSSAGVRMTSGQNPPSGGSFASIHIGLPPGGCLLIGQENSVSIRIDAGEEPPAPPAAPESPNNQETPLSLSDSGVTPPPSAQSSAPTSPVLRQSGGNKAKALEFKVVRYKLRYRGHLIRTAFNGAVRYYIPMAGGPPKPAEQLSNLASFHQEYEHEAMSGDISDVCVPLRGGNHEFVTLLNVKDGLFPSIGTESSALIQIQWSLHIEVKFGNHSPEAVIPVLLSVPPISPFRPASAYPEGQRVVDVKFARNLISIPVAYPATSGDRWKVLSGTSWNLSQPAAAPVAPAQDLETPQ
eukprot:TRINITY_DN6978_c0_g1_i1.p1 TRINITY_DN6978_c0_g1~~TRINITY_DN6978_c0_g1_i1.p1  ORF type:complete len:643 (-),score=100.64 TRINITY_DN6978_c0_g1_i1:847-2754(-)